MNVERVHAARPWERQHQNKVLTRSIAVHHRTHWNEVRRLLSVLQSWRPTGQKKASTSLNVTVQTTPTKSPYTAFLCMSKPPAWSGPHSDTQALLPRCPPKDKSGERSELLHDAQE